MAEEVKKEEVQEKLLTQAQVDAIVQERLAREKAKYADYDTTKQKLADYERLNSEKAQKELEAQKEYEKAKETLLKEKTDLQSLVSKKDAEIADSKISSALMIEVMKQNAYAEETMALIKSQAVFDKEGNIRIKGRDTNGLEVMDSVEEGLKKFLTQRPHLVKATRPGGGGTPPVNPAGGPGVGGEDLNTLNEQFLDAQKRGDYKAIKELKIKINAALAHQGIRR